MKYKQYFESGLLVPIKNLKQLTQTNTGHVQICDFQL